MNNIVYKKHITSFGVLGIFAICIWFLGPSITIGDLTPLLQVEERAYAIVLLFLLWLLKIIFFEADPSTLPPTDPELIKKIKALEGRIAGATQFLQKTAITKQGKNIHLHQLPWYLFVGPAQSGKTTLLANTQVNFILSKQFKQQDTQQPSISETCDWWVTRDLTIIDVPSKYVTTNSTLWSALLTLITKYRNKQAIQGIILALPLPELMESFSQQKMVEMSQTLLQRIHEIQQQFNLKIPVYFIITKCDRLPGFVEFFKDSGGDELAQTWGISLPPLKENEKHIDIFINRFNLLIKRLNKQLIWRMHQERTSAARPYIKDFPLQVERLKGMIATLIKVFSADQVQPMMRGIYLTSAIQPMMQENNQHATYLGDSQVTDTTLQIFNGPVSQSKPYFIKQLLLQGLTSAATHITPQSTLKRKSQKLIYLSLLGLLGIATIFLGKEFQDNLQRAHTTQTNLANYQAILQITKPIERLLMATPMITALKQESVNTTSSRLPNLFSAYSNKLRQTAQIAYQQALQTVVLTGIKDYFEGYLQNSQDKKPEQTYAVLKSYLMLGNSQYKQDELVLSTIEQLFQQNANNKIKQPLIDIIKAALALNLSLSLDSALVEKTQKHLNNLPSSELSYVILKNINNNNLTTDINLGINIGTPPALISQALDNNIPRLFTAQTFSTILSRDIPTAAQEAMQGNWVLGHELASHRNPAQITTLVGQLQTSYVNHYIDLWESLLADIHLYKPQNLVQTNAMIANLISKNSPLLQLLQTIQKNTHFSAIMLASPKIQGLNMMMVNSGSSDAEGNTLYSIFIALKSLHQYLNPIITAPDQGKAAFSAVTQRIRHTSSAADPLITLLTLADTTPEPVKNWLTSIAESVQHYLLQETAQYINLQWQTQVSDIYQSQIAHRYPFIKSAQTDIALPHFIRFFGNPGILSQFYQGYLQDFVDNSTHHWQWKTIDNQPLPFSNEALQQIQRAFRVQRAFFQDGNNKLNVPFILQPLPLSKNIKSFNLTINGQSIAFDNSAMPIPRKLAWPGENQNNHDTHYSWVTPNQKTISGNIHGDWGWFKLVDQSMQRIYARKKILLNFSTPEYQAKYLLFTQGHVNPFLPLNFQDFYLPSELIEKQEFPLNKV